MSVRRNGTVFDKGTDAYCFGLPCSACPYPSDTAEYLEWMRGWHEAKVIDHENREH